MYYPYFRGKQYELITIRESAALLMKAGFRPIIEPVKEDLSGLQKALDAIIQAGGRAIVIVNPQDGELSGKSRGEELAGLLEAKPSLSDSISAGILLNSHMPLAEVTALSRSHAAQNPVLIHAGFIEARPLANSLGTLTKAQTHVFLNESSGGKLYQKHFKGAFRVLVRDGFKRRPQNKDYPDLEPFSDLHVTFREEGMDGFGDFLIVGSEYSDTGGIPYVLAIHLTFIDPDQDDSMQIYHFKSKTHITQKDPAGKFAEALAKMMTVLDAPGSKVLETAAVKEFRDLYKRKHFPGLGYIKKLSMSHHIETLARYFENAG
jgi:hypothetical protein